MICGMVCCINNEQAHKQGRRGALLGVLWQRTLGQHCELHAGAQVPYLAPHYVNYQGPHMLPHQAKGVRMLMQQHFKYRNPLPAPFDQGILTNLNTFFFEARPVAYHEHYRSAQGRELSNA